MEITRKSIGWRKSFFFFKMKLQVWLQLAGNIKAIVMHLSGWFMWSLYVLIENFFGQFPIDLVYQISFNNQ